MNKNIDNTVESAYPKYSNEEDWFEQSEAILSFGVSEMFENQNGGGGKGSKK